jgi:hypothetical protein
MKSVIESKIEYLSAKDRIFFKKHALTRMLERSIESDEVVEALSNCEIIKKYEQDKPLSSYLIIGYTAEKKPLHINLAIDAIDEMLWIITVYRPDKKVWTADYKRRQ